MVWRLFRHDAARQRKRIALTVLAIAWGTLSIVLLLSFGEGMKRSFHRNTRGMGEGIAVLWPGATTKRLWACPPAARSRFTDEDADAARRAHPGDRRDQPRVRPARPRRPRAEDGQRAHARRRALLRRDAQHHPPARRPLPERADLAQKRRVVFLGDELANDLFGTDDPVGKTVPINQSDLPGGRRDAAEDDDGHVQRARQEPGLDPRHHLQGDVHRRPSGTWSTSR